MCSLSSSQCALRNCMEGIGQERSSMRESSAIYDCRGFPLPERSEALISIHFQIKA